MVSITQTWYDLKMVSFWTACKQIIQMLYLVFYLAGFGHAAEQHCPRKKDFRVCRLKHKTPVVYLLQAVKAVLSLWEKLSPDFEQEHYWDFGHCCWGKSHKLVSLTETVTCLQACFSNSQGILPFRQPHSQPMDSCLSSLVCTFPCSLPPSLPTC